MHYLLLIPLAFGAAAAASAQAPATPAGPAVLLAQKSPASADDLVESARLQLQAGNAQRALALAQQARRADPSSYKPPYYIAYALMALGDFGGAAEAQASSLDLANSPDQKAAVQALGETIVAQGAVREADKAAEDGLDAKAARLYKEAFDAGLQRPDIGLKAAKLFEDRLKDVPAAVRLLRAVQDRFPGSPAAGTAGAELARLQPALASATQERLKVALSEPRGTRSPLLSEVLAVDPDNADALFAMANEATAGTDWSQLQPWLKALLQRRLLEEGLRSGKVRLRTWNGDAKVRGLLEDAWGAQAAGKALNTAARASLQIKISALEEEPVIRSLVAGGPGQKAELKVGDRIVSIAGVATSTSRDVVREMSLLPAVLPVAIVVRRDGKLYRHFSSPDNVTSQAGNCIALGISYQSYEGDCVGGLAEGKGRARYEAVNDVQAVYDGGFMGGFPSGPGQVTLHTKTGPKVVEMIDGKPVAD